MTRQLSTTIGLVVLLLLLVPGVAEASWSQAGYDAGSTGASPDRGPALDETSYIVELPGALRTVAWPGGGFSTSEPLIVNGTAYVPVVPSAQDERLDGRGIATVELATGHVELFIEMERDRLDRWTGIAVEDGTLFVPRSDALNAFDASTGELLWEALAPPLGVRVTGDVTLDDTDRCQAPAVGDGLVVLACAGGRQRTNNDPVAWAVDADTGEVLWGRMLTPTAERQEGIFTDASQSETRDWSLGVSMNGTTAYPITVQASQWDPRLTTRYTLWALDTASGEVRWSRTTDPGLSLSPVGIDQDAGTNGTYPKLAPRATATDRVVYVNMAGTLQAINPAQEEPVTLWSARLGQEDASAETFVGATSALVGDTLYAAASQSIYRFDAASTAGAEAWRVSVDVGEEIASGSLIAADGVLYALTHGADFDFGALYAFDASTGERLWRHELTPAGDQSQVRFGYALADGLLVAAGTDGSFHVLGRTPASLEPVAEPSSRIPGPGEQLTVDLSRTGPGLHGNATAFRADWGDGNATSWQDSPMLSHTYTEPGEKVARFWVRNDAGQSTSTQLVFDVGATEPNFVETAFARENQEMTFGVLGIAMALGGGLIGVGRRYRKRSRLQEELEALEEGFEETRGNPGECEALLDNRKARARSLLLDGVLTEEQFGVIEGRVTELHRELRTTVLDERFQFLPHGMVTSIKKMLADGRLTAWERDALEDLLDREEALSQAQKDQVRAQLDRWFGDDAGRGGPG